MDEEELAAIASLLEDEYARAILRHTSEQPLSASDLMDRCDASKATTYRRIDRLREHELIESYQEYDPAGHHYEVYAATLDELTVGLDDGEFAVSVDRTDDPADRMTDLFNELK
ncbi:helix-turn-helix domain-containing protein [Halorubrum sp. SD683]|uniref:ArsR/SmtB family transcription factor n=1 Tax=Halorubrum sp. SD683 TaxID=1855873 RepID=UPI000A2E01DB|nr:helix-turn-helix domain-containing protein [Halorubrum sp. SD683]OTF01932.1 ArsR family transcriptional regulator [Halorubrum sp. SD683]